MSVNMNAELVNKFCKNTMIEHLGIEFVTIEKGFVEATMPVDERTIQPLKMLHGGASVALAESIASLGSAYLIDAESQIINGLEINANHIKGVPMGSKVFAEAKIAHHGKTTHVWDIRIFNEQKELVCVSRMTNIVLNRK
jgi:1,4-dihydroxy-2-naphthoyl-CoA hydrolase